MTFTQHFITELVHAGVRGADALEIMERSEASPLLNAMVGKWGEDISGFPPFLLAPIWLSVKDVAVEYLKETNPENPVIAALENVVVFEGPDRQPIEAELLKMAGECRERGDGPMALALLIVRGISRKCPENLMQYGLIGNALYDLQKKAPE